MGNPVKTSRRLIWAGAIARVVLAPSVGVLRYWGVIGAAVSPTLYAATMVFVSGENRAYLFAGRYEGLSGTAYSSNLWAWDRPGTDCRYVGL